MKITNLRTEKNSDRTRVAATVIWEDCNRPRPTQEIYIETTPAFGQDLSCNPHPFLIASVMPAMRHGEARISIDAEICPQLRNGLVTAMSLMRHWYGSKRQLVQIEARAKSNILTKYVSSRAGLLLSGGIDSLAALRANRLDFSATHPNYFKDGLLIHRIEKGKGLDLFKPAVRALSEIALTANINLIPVYTNIRDLDTSSAFWGKEFQGSALAAIAHAFSPRLSTITIPSSFDINNLYPYGTHPLLDQNYSSSELQVLHGDILLTRLAKTKLVADWDVALQRVRVCNQPQAIEPGALNCGRCEKCIRTMLALMALEKLDKTSAFPEIELSEKLIQSEAYIKDPPYAESCYRELIAPLIAKGRHDLVRGIKRIIAQYYREKRLNKMRDQLSQGIFSKIHRVLLMQ